MANKESSFKENVDGPFFVDDSCIACVSCITLAGKYFKLKNGNEHSYVFCQPQTPEEFEDCRKALAACPVDAIGETVLCQS